MLLGASRGTFPRWLLPTQLLFGGLQSNHHLSGAAHAQTEAR